VRLLSAGFTPEECAAIRGLSTDTVLDHALRAADAGLNRAGMVSERRVVIATIERVVGPATPTGIRPLLGAIAGGTPV